MEYIPPKIGCDPELFVANHRGKFVSVHDFLPGTKSDPSFVDKGAVQADGTAAEFNIIPAESAEEFSENIRTVLTQLQNIIKLHNPKLSLRVVPTATFDKRYFKKLPIEALRFGCDPDRNAYTTEYLPPQTTEPFRTGGGHIHIGWGAGYDPNESAHVFDCIEATKQLDAVLYPLSLLWDSDTKRRTLYGKIGSFRAKPYGVEYRPLSNAWVADPDLHLWIFEAARWAMKKMDQDDIRLQADVGCHNLVKDLMNDGDIRKTDLLYHHEWLVSDMDCPALPDSYLE